MASQYTNGDTDKVSGTVPVLIILQSSGESIDWNESSDLLVWPP